MSEASTLIPEEVVEGAETFEEFYHAIESQMMDYLKSSYKVPQTSWEQFQAFLVAVNWNEKLILGLICFHVTLLLIFIFFRRNIDVQMVLLLLISGLVYFSENINRWGSLHWREFASQNYFDKNGVFMGIFYAAPMLLIATAQLINILLLTSSTLITVKRAELRQRLKQQREAQQGDAANDSIPVSQENTDSSPGDDSKKNK